MTALDRINGDKQPVRILENEDWFRVTARTPAGKAHRAYATADGYILQLSCSCPGSQNGSLRKKCRLVSNGWEKANCGN
jgi:hypothetical protein